MGKRLFDKLLACLYCGKVLKHRISEHLQHAHSEEIEVAKALALPPKSRERKLLFQKLNYKGNFIHNIKVVNGEKDGVFIVSRRSTTITNFRFNYLPCPSCCGFFVAADLWRHSRKCPHKSACVSGATEECKTVKAEASLLFQSALLPEHPDNNLLAPVLEKMQKDLTFRSLQNDRLIIRMGVILKEKLGMRRKNDIAQRMRQLARLKQEMEFNNMTDAVKGKRFDDVVKSTHSLCGIQTNDGGINVFERPG